jgi:hypothetical protein
MRKAPEKELEPAPDRNGARARTAIISAPAGLATRELRAALAQRGIESFAPDEAAVSGQSLGEALREVVRKADLMIAVLDPQRDNRNVFLELGVALGLDKPILLLSSAGELLPGVTLTGIPTVRASPEDGERIAFALDQVLSAPNRRQSPGQKPPKQTHPLGPQAEGPLSEAAGASPHRLEEIVWDAIARSGVSIHSRPQEGVMALWSDDLEPWVSNPLLVTVKAELQTQDLLAAVEQVRQALAKRGAEWGLLLYSGPIPKAVGESLQGSPVLAISIPDFLHALREEGFADIVLRLRNRRAPGGARHAEV